MDFWEIHDQYYRRVRGFILSLVRDDSLTDDLVQETFIRIQQNQDRLRDPSKMSSWIFRIAYNLCQDHFRKRKESSLDENGIKEKAGDSEALGVEKEMEQRQMGQCVQDKINLLPEPLRQEYQIVIAGKTDSRYIGEVHKRIDGLRLRALFHFLDYVLLLQYIF